LPRPRHDQVDWPIRYANFVTLGYLVATLPLLWRSGPSAGAAVISMAHVGAICVCWATTKRSRPSKVSDWLPLALVPFLYAELPYLMGRAVAYHDSAVQQWEAALFGGQPARTLAGAAPGCALSELLHLGYLSYYLIIYIPPFALYKAGRRDAFGRAVLASMLIYAACFLTFALFPVQGPRYMWGAPANVPDGAVRALALFILERGSARGAAFPSSHAAVAVAQAVVTIRYQRRLGMTVAIASLMLMIGAVYAGFHYAVDIVAGAIVGLAVSVVVLTWRQSVDQSQRTG
jgi:membrane-associated phospholipid phosphatase